MPATMKRSQRTDVHAPSKIDPTEYEYVCQECCKIEGLGDALFIQEERKIFAVHRERTGGSMSRHEHGGNCMVCGSVNAIYTAIFYHAKTNSYIRVGQDCAEKMDFEDAGAFKAFRKNVDDARQLQKGKNKAKALLTDAGVFDAWTISTMTVEESLEAGASVMREGWDEYRNEYGRHAVMTRDCTILCDIVGKVVKYGDLSDKQAKFLGTLINNIRNAKEVKAKRDAEKANAADCPTGRKTITCTVIKTEVRDGNFGTEYKMTVKSDDGFLAWGTIPSILQLIEVEQGGFSGTFEEYASGHPESVRNNPTADEALRRMYAEAQKPNKVQRGLAKGDRIELTATFTKSDRDAKFGFFKRPNGKLIK